jgi:hypothetical protein
MKPYQYAETTRLSRRLKMNGVFTIIVVCGLGMGSMIVPLQMSRTLITRVTTALIVALADRTR